MAMHWVLQLDLEIGHTEEAMLRALTIRNIPFTAVKVIPFSHELIPEPDLPDVKVMTYGGVVMREVSEKRGWSPGFYWNDNFEYGAWRANWGEHLLNSSAVVSTFGEVAHRWGKFFIRPCATDKTFTGSVVTWEEFEKWREEVRSGNVSHRYLGLTDSTPVMYDRYQDIADECRFFIAGGKIATASYYRIDGRSKCIPFYDTPWYSAAMEEFVQARTQEWALAPAYVLDIARRADGILKIIEVNCYNSSGLYECDTLKLVDALEELEA